MSKEFAEWWQTVKNKPGNRYEDAFTAGRALGRREMRRSSMQAVCDVLCHPIHTEIYQMGYENCKRNTLDAIEAIPEEVGGAE